jgi:hypothetical protein
MLQIVHLLQLFADRGMKVLSFEALLLQLHSSARQRNERLHLLGQQLEAAGVKMSALPQARQPTDFQSARAPKRSALDRGLASFQDLRIVPHMQAPGTSSTVRLCSGPCEQLSRATWSAASWWTPGCEKSTRATACRASRYGAWSRQQRSSGKQKFIRRGCPMQRGRNPKTSTRLMGARGSS